MHFVINVFVAGVCFISLILFKEIFNKTLNIFLVISYGSNQSFLLFILLFVLLLQREIKLKSKLYFFIPTAFFASPSATSL